MAADRQFPTSGTGPDYMAKIALEGTTLYNAAVLPLTVTGGTADDVEATCAPALTAGVLAGMSFWWTASADNTGPMMMEIDGNAAIGVKNDDGSDLPAGVIKGGRRYLLTAAGGVLIATGTVNIQKVDDFQVFDTVGDFTWYKPSGTPDDALVILKMWAGGGGGGYGTAGALAFTAGAGGGGGGYLEFSGRASDLAASVDGTVGAGGAAGISGSAKGAVGGNSIFGEIVVYGGGGGQGSNGSGEVGGDGGGAFRAGSAGAGDGSAGTGGNGTGTGGTARGNPGSNGGVTGGAGGGGSIYSSGGNGGGAGGKAIFAGGGGAGGSNGSGNGVGGHSLFGGSGGNSGADGQPRGGGGGGGYQGAGAGGRGEIHVHVIG